MKTLSLILFTLVILLQYPLWLGKASWLNVWKADQEITAARKNNLKLQNRNIILAADVNDLKQGYDAIEEHARSDLKMIKQNEILFQVIERNPSSTSLSKNYND